MLKPVQIIKGFVADRERDDGIDEEVIRLNVEQRSENQGDGVTDRERRNELNDIFEAREEEHNPEEKQEMVVARQHVNSTESDEFERTGRERSGLIGLGHAVGHDGNGDAQKSGQ